MKVFVDTNVLVYAYDRGAGSKHERALSVVEKLWIDGSGVLSTQVLQEFYVNVRRKAQKPISHKQARALIAYCGLDWDPACLDFHSTPRSVRTASAAQVRQPIYDGSVAAWQRYESKIGLLLDALQD